MYNYPPPPWWGYGGPPQNNQNINRGPSRRDLDKIAKNAVREALRLKDSDKNAKRKRKAEQAKQAGEKMKKFANFIYIFALGILLHPVVGPLYHKLIGYIQ